MSRTLKINGTTYEIGNDVEPDDRLVYFLHERNLLGTHITCYEGGCGACIVVASVPNPVTKEREIYPVNSCVVPVLNCVDWEITTIEGLGNSYDGYHVIQKRLAEYAGTQCGYCSPGFVMSMYGMTQSNASWTPEDVERSLDGNICRCTGYRPILDAFKSVTPTDIEDSHTARCPSTGKPCQGKCASKKANKEKEKPTCCSNQLKSHQGKTVKGTSWYQPTTLQELYHIIAGLPDNARYSLICGNTAQAVVGVDYSTSATIFTRRIPDLLHVEKSSTEARFGANVSISSLMTEMRSHSATKGFNYLSHLADAWQHVAGTAIRNMASWAGNLALMMAHKGFPSDLFTHLAAAGAKVTLASTDGTKTTHTLEELIDIDIVSEKNIIFELTLEPMDDDVVFRVFKVAPRSVNSHAFVNAGFKLKVDSTNSHTLNGTPTLIFGGINTTFIHASATEQALADKSLEDDKVIQAALDALAKEVVPDVGPLDPEAEYKVALTQNMLYKTILGTVGEVASEDLRSGAKDIQRSLNTGKQTYDENKEFWPLGEPIPKLESYVQCSGEADYCSSTPSQVGELFGLFVTSTQANAKIVSIDATEALKIPGVIAFIGIDDITGENNIKGSSSSVENLFPKERVSYYGQPLGVVVCEGREPAYPAKAAVKVTYEDIQPPILTVQEALKNPLPGGQPKPHIKGDVEAGFSESTHVVQGVMDMNGQYHFAMEPQICIASPTDQGGVQVFIATQDATETQRSIGKVLGIADHKVNVTCKKMGGAFGARNTRCNVVATATALAAQKTRRPVRMSLDFKDNMEIIGWRSPFYVVYKAGVDNNGKLKAIESTLTGDPGYTSVEEYSGLAAGFMPSCYDIPNWKLAPQFVLTNTACNTTCRSPGLVNGMMAMETILDQVAFTLGLDPLQVRRDNLMPDGTTAPYSDELFKLKANIPKDEELQTPKEAVLTTNLIATMIDQIVASSDYVARKNAIEEFNKSNKWKKRGIALMPERFPYGTAPNYPMNALVSISAGDGSVLVSHGGAEMGQGLNTKVAQCAAYELGIPLELVAIKDTNTHDNCNSVGTNGNNGSNFCSFSVSMACRNLRTRLDDYKKSIGNPTMDWAELVRSALDAGVDICERYVNKTDEVKAYDVFVVGVSEVEVDVLTGQFTVLRADVLEDAGRSLSALVDVGQVEGGFIMGQGLFTLEKPVYDPKSGERISNSTWNYKPPTALDIPADFRVTLLQDTPNPKGVHSSKITGEPPLNVGFSIVMALRQAISSARADGGNKDWFQIDTPLTVDKIQRLCLVDSNRLVLKDA